MLKFRAAALLQPLPTSKQHLSSIENHMGHVDPSRVEVSRGVTGQWKNGITVCKGFDNTLEFQQGRGKIRKVSQVLITNLTVPSFPELFITLCIMYTKIRRKSYSHTISQNPLIYKTLRALLFHSPSQSL